MLRSLWLQNEAAEHARELQAAEQAANAAAADASCASQARHCCSQLLEEAVFCMLQQACCHVIFEHLPLFFCLISSKAEYAVMSHNIGVVDSHPNISDDCSSSTSGGCVSRHLWTNMFAGEFWAGCQ